MNGPEKEKTKTHSAEIQKGGYDTMENKITILSNFEVYDDLKNIVHHANSSAGKQSSHLKIAQQTLKYLSSTPCVNQSEASVGLCLQKLAKFNLTTYEKLQLVNFGAISDADFTVIIDEGHERFSDEDISSICSILGTVFPPITMNGETNGNS